MRNVDGQKYEIKTVEDFAAIPLERMGDCLVDFFHFMRARQALVKAGMSPDIDSFFWVDDDKREVTIVFKRKTKIPE